MTDVIGTVASKTGLPRWWVESIAIEYTDCRQYATTKEIWSFDFGKISEADLQRAVDNHRVVVRGTLYHNIDQDVLTLRIVGRMASNVPVQMVEHIDDIIANGPVSSYHIPFEANSFDAWDPKTDFSAYFQVLDNRVLWQWQIADFRAVSGTNRGRWFSDDVDLDPLVEVQDRLNVLRNHPLRPGQAGHSDFQIKVKEFYLWLDTIRRPILSALEGVHEAKRARADYSKCSITRPPVLSKFEKFTVRVQEIFSQFYAEAIFYRGCRDHSAKALDIAASAKNRRECIASLDQIYEERAVSIILGAACMEAFINGLMSEHFPNLSDNVDSLTLSAKFQLFLSGLSHISGPTQPIVLAPTDTF